MRAGPPWARLELKLAWVLQCADTSAGSKLETVLPGFLSSCIFPLFSPSSISVKFWRLPRILTYYTNNFAV